MPRTYTFEGNRNQKWTQEHARRASEMRKQGLTQKAIAKELGLSQQTVSRYLKPEIAPTPQPLPRAAGPRQVVNSASKDRYVPNMTARMSGCDGLRGCAQPWILI